VRLHHYFRILSSADAHRVIQSLGGFSLSIEVTEEWYDPPDGIIASIPPNSPVLGSHAIGGLQHAPGSNLLLFPNSWGEKWGHEGWGMIAPELIDRYLVECWAMVGVAKFPPLTTKSGLVVLLWKSSESGQEVHGREILDADSGERIGWCFLVRRGNVLDIEELFVWPTHRRNGFGSILADLARELAVKANCKLRALVSYADSEASNRPALTRIIESLGLHLHPSTIKSVAFLGLQETYVGVLPEPSLPLRPASIHDRLNPEKGTRLYTVWFGTNRKPMRPGDPKQGFSNQRDVQVHYGTCQVAIPRSHHFGSIGASWLRRTLRLSDDEPLSIVRLAYNPADEFWREITTELGKYPNERQALVFLHGYRNTFDQAAIRAAQIGFDMKIPGVTAFFSWASAGAALDYPTDEATIEASEPAITDFLKDFVSRSGAERIHLIAHSMGNRGLLRAVQRIVGSVPTVPGIRFGQIILAAPDVDTAVFRDLARHLGGVSLRTTLYVSPSDRAVGLSEWLHHYPRAGLTPPVTVFPGIDTVEIPLLDLTDSTWHSYFAETASLLHDIFVLIRMNLPPDDRQRLVQSQTESGERYWTMIQ
jgi:esterase/lipase superfamily enzyme/GNAT superfamily N-acetyltransferase